MRVLIRTPLTPYTGYGNDGIGIVKAFMEAGCHVMLDPAYAQPPWPPFLAQLMTNPVVPPFDLYVCHADPGRVDISPGVKKNALLSLVWTMWEYETFENMDSTGRHHLLEHISEFDVFACYDDPTEKSVNHYIAKHNVEPSPIVLRQSGGYIPGDYQLKEGTPNDRVWEKGKPFRFAMVGQLGQRKDPFVAIQAFRELKEDPDIEFEDAELHLKTNAVGLHPMLEEHIPKLRIHYVTWPRDVLNAFMANCHVLLAPSRGEGKNMPALEFMTLGGTVIATNWGGHLSWLNDDYSYRLNYREGHEPGKPDCISARASKDHLKELMLHTYNNRGEAKIKGEIAARTIPGLQNWDSCVETLMHQLAFFDGPPARVADLFFRARSTREYHRDQMP